MYKKLKMAGLMLLACTLTTAVGASLTTETASAKTVKAKKLKMKKKKVTVLTGNKTTLKVTVKPKNATLKWKSSKTKVAKVSKKGVVTGKKAGKATITVTSAKKKAKCKVTVKQKYSMKSVVARNSHVVRVTLSKAKKLSASNFVVQTKHNAVGAYNATLQVASVVNVGGKNLTYDLVLAHPEENDDFANELMEYDSINSLSNGEYVKATVKALNGVKSVESQVNLSSVPYNEYVTGIVNKPLVYYAYMGGNPVGAIKGLKLSGTLPSGLTAKAYAEAGCIVISGTPKSVVNGGYLTMSGKDETGRTISQRVYFYIGDANHIVTYVEAEGRTFLTNNNETKYYDINVVGGDTDNGFDVALNTQNNPYISLDDDYAQIRISSGDSVAKKYIAAGNYAPSYVITDNKGVKSAVTTVSLKGIAGVEVTGKITAGDGSAMEDASVRANFIDTKHEYYSSSMYAYPDYKTAVYSMVVVPSKLYSMRAYCDEVTQNAEYVEVGNARVTRNFVLPIYKVVFASPELKDISFSVKNAVTGNSISCYGGQMYLKKGSYTVDYVDYPDNDGFENTTVSVKGAFTVTGNMNNVPLTVNKVTTPYYDNMGTLTAGSAQNVDSSTYYWFTPAESGEYAISSTSEDEVEVDLYNVNDRYDEIDYGYTSVDGEYTTVSLNANQKYVLKFDSSASVTITKALEEPAE